MSAVRDKNLLFYSLHPNDEDSRKFMIELNKNPLLKKQFILICVSDPNIKIPDQIVKMNTCPVLIVANMKRPILGADALSWLTNGGFQDKANGMDFGSLNGHDSGQFAYVGDDLNPSDYNQFHNDEYNRGFHDKDSILNNQFSKLTESSHVVTYDDSNELKKDISDKMNQRLSQLRSQRDTDVPRAVKRIGGLEDLQQGSNPNRQPQSQGNPMGGFGGGIQNQQMGGGAPTMAYNPNPFGNHNMNQNAPQLPFQIPQLPFQMPQMNNNNRQMSQPQLPFQMPGMGYQPNNNTAPRLPFQMPQSGGYRNPNL